MHATAHCARTRKLGESGRLRQLRAPGECLAAGQLRRAQVEAKDCFGLRVVVGLNPLWQRPSCRRASLLERKVAVVAHSRSDWLPAQRVGRSERELREMHARGARA